MRINCCVFTVQCPVREEKWEGKKGETQINRKYVHLSLVPYFNIQGELGHKLGRYCA